MLTIPDWMFNKKCKKPWGKKIEYNAYDIYMKGYFSITELQQITGVALQLQDNKKNDKTKT